MKIDGKNLKQLNLQSYDSEYYACLIRTLNLLWKIIRK